MVSREGKFFFNNLSSSGSLFRALGTLFPILSEWVRGVKITYGPATFNFVNIPLVWCCSCHGDRAAHRLAPGIVAESAAAVRRAVTSGVFMLLILPWRACGIWARCSRSYRRVCVRDSHSGIRARARARHRQYGEPIAFAVVQLLTRNRRRYGGYIVHIAIVLLFVAFAGMAFKDRDAGDTRPGDSVTLKSPYGHLYTFTHWVFPSYNALNREVTAALSSFVVMANRSAACD